MAEARRAHVQIRSGSSSSSELKLEFGQLGGNSSYILKNPAHITLHIAAGSRENSEMLDVLHDAYMHKQMSHSRARCPWMRLIVAIWVDLLCEGLVCSQLCLIRMNLPESKLMAFPTLCPFCEPALQLASMQLAGCSDRTVANRASL